MIKLGSMRSEIRYLVVCRNWHANVPWNGSIIVQENRTFWVAELQRRLRLFA